jgi:hypothetical protein
LHNLVTVLKRLNRFRIIINLRKSKFGLRELSYLGHTINQHGISMSPARKEHIANIRPPRTITELQSYLGLCNFFRQHIAHYAAITAPLYRHTSLSKRAKLPWGDEEQTAFSLLQRTMADAPILRFLADQGDIILYTDAWN